MASTDLVVGDFAIEHAPGHRMRRFFSSAAFWLTIGAFLLFAVFPVYWMFVTTFKQINDLYSLDENPLIFNLAPTLEHVQFLWDQTRYPTWLVNTVEIGVFTVIITLLVSIPAAYALARSRFPGSGTLGIGIFLTYLIPPTLLFLPLSQIVVGLGLINTRWSLVLVYPTFTIPFCTWLLMGFFRGVPREMTEAARVDGCSRLGALFRVVLPVSLPGILTVVIFAFTLTMQEYVYALTFVSEQTEKTVTLGVSADLIRGDVFAWSSLMAGALIISVPVAIAYNFFLDTFVKGITGGAVK
ncbi:MAG: carbohydrate ABC transporter permease [Chloroflexota bacterium]|nr:carbohydrate ABC transporter permease [Chloroflexota bacterium]MDE3192060.1 carbohydrate ABC transporter permease [Chloroflexota bacterium]